MFKRLLSVALILCFASAAFAQSNALFELISQTETQAVVKVTVPAPVFKEVETPQGIQYSVSLDNGTPIMKKGAPDLQKLSTALACVDGMKWSISDISTGSPVVYNKVIAPSKGKLYRNAAAENVPFEYSAIYTQNATFPENIAYLRDPFVNRDFAGQALVVQPDVYDAGTQTLLHYSIVTITLKAVPDASGVTTLARTQPVTAEFDKLYKSRFLNYNIAKQSRYTQLEEQGEMLVICHDDFMTAMQPFVNWKNQRGLRTVMVPVSAVGTTAAAIKTYVQNYYADADNDLTYLLLVGDVAQIPASSTQHGTSDNHYGYLAGNDSYPELFVGRFSANSVDELIPQIEKSIAYEKNPATGANAAWYKRGIAVASNQGAGQGINGWPDWTHQRYIRGMLLGYGYTDVQELYDGTHTGVGYNDQPGNPSAQNLIDEINTGASIINYTGHGDWDVLVTTQFDNDDVAALTNVGKWPFVWVVGCNAGIFDDNIACLGESLARATTPAGHTGAVASLMSTILQSWEPPMYAQYECNQILTETIAGNIKRTFAGISMNACMGMNDAYGQDGDEMTDTWTLFGDPSLVIRTDVPGALTVNHPAAVPVGTNTIQISSNTNGALASLTLNNQILTTAVVSGGVATFNFPSVMMPDTLVVTVTAYNKTPYIGQIFVVPGNGPFVVADAYNVYDPAGNNNQLADYNEVFSLNVNLKNVGNAAASDVTATLTSTDPNITILNATHSFGAVDSGATATAYGAFSLKAAALITDQHAAQLVMNVTDNNGNSWQNPIQVMLHAPKLSVVSYSVSDAAGNNNGVIEPGENVSIILDTKNNGSSSTVSGSGVFTAGGSQVTVFTATQSGDAFPPGSMLSQSFDVTVHSDASLYSFVTFDYAYDAGGYTATRTFKLKIGQATEDFETNDFSKFAWEQSAKPWFTTTTSPFDGTYCSQSGSIGNSASSSMSITVHSVTDDTIRFARRVSSEATFDFLKFFIDNDLLDSWSGAEGWAVVKYPVSAGSHTFRWTYSKDYTQVSGADAAWVDDIQLPLNTFATAIFETSEETHQDISLYPNPAAAFTTIWYALGEVSDVSVNVYNMLGQHVTELQPMKRQQTGSYELQLQTSELTAGQYIVTFRVNGQTHSRKLDVIR